MCILKHYLLAFGAYRLFPMLFRLFTISCGTDAVVLFWAQFFCLPSYTFLHFLVLAVCWILVVFEYHTLHLYFVFLLRLFIVVIVCNIKCIHHNFVTSFAWIIFIFGRYLFYVHAFFFTCSSFFSIPSSYYCQCEGIFQNTQIFICISANLVWSESHLCSFFLFSSFLYFHEFKSWPSLGRHFRKFSLICELGNNLTLVV